MVIAEEKDPQGYKDTCEVAIDDGQHGLTGWDRPLNREAVGHSQQRLPHQAVHLGILPTRGHDGGQDTFRTRYASWPRIWNYDLFLVDARFLFPQVRRVMDPCVFASSTPAQELWAEGLLKASLEWVLDELLSEIARVRPNRVVRLDGASRGVR